MGRNAFRSHRFRHSGHRGGVRSLQERSTAISSQRKDSDELNDSLVLLFASVYTYQPVLDHRFRDGAAAVAWWIGA